ncbi:DUF2868 domain-containing protein [Gilvimarinus sp. F26214L]|uniref:DUF2868 domain-containing protein n=1 Tax=Gilvimarinus sp. DZF01 TaxID=3461371 RepID=UPI00404686E2
MLTSSLSLIDLLRLDRQLRRDQDLSLRELQERDRRIGATLPSASPKRCLKTWLSATGEAAGGERLAGIEMSVGFWMGLLGLLLGFFAMSGLLLVDRQQPVNVLLFLAVFIGSQWLLLLLTVLVVVAFTLNPQMHLPLEALNPARWMFTRHLRRLAGDIRREQFTPVLRLALLTWGQLFGVLFNAGALIALLLILMVVDRSFGWSSTLNVSSEGLYRLMDLLAAPWSWELPGATVDADVVAATRYQSLQTIFSADQVAAMRAWWPFLFACIAFYGLLPRVLLWIGFYVAYRRRLLDSFVNYPGARLVVQRMTSPLVHTRGQNHEGALDSGDALVSRQGLPAGKPRTVVNWSGALSGNARTLLPRLGLPETGTESAGLGLGEDQRLLNRINQQQQDVVILVKSWEPPLGELGDFLRGISPKLDCYLLLLPLGDRGVKPDELADWQQFARQGHHPRLVVVPAQTSQGAEATQ